MGVYVAQLLPDAEQAQVLIRALRQYADKMEAEGNIDEQFKADEIRLDLLKKQRQFNAARRGV